jgi:multiple sugar transport system substrate-binding protein
MKKILAVTLVFLFSLCLSTSALAQTKEIRVLLANHPYGDLLKTAIPDFEKRYRYPGQVSNNCRKASSPTKLTTEFATHARRPSTCS